MSITYRFLYCPVPTMGVAINTLPAARFSSEASLQNDQGPLLFEIEALIAQTRKRK